MALLCKEDGFPDRLVVRLCRGGVGTQGEALLQIRGVQVGIPQPRHVSHPWSCLVEEQKALMGALFCAGQKKLYNSY